MQGTQFRALCKCCWCCGSDNLVQVVPAMMLSVNITISMDEIKMGLVGFTKCIILSKASMFPTMVQFTKCKIPIPKHLVLLVLQMFPPNHRKPQNCVLFLIRINYKEFTCLPDSDYTMGSPKT